MANLPPRVEMVFDMASVGGVTPLPTVVRALRMLRCPGVSALLPL